MKKLIISLLSIGIFVLPTNYALAVEPLLEDYTNYPIFTVNPVKPNILIILDNSGSMNGNAYGTYNGNGGIVTTQPFAGAPYQPNIEVNATDDAEQHVSGGAPWLNGSLDLGNVNGSSTNTFVGIRFQDIYIPRGSTITNAYLELTADTTLGASNVTFSIVAEDNDQSQPFTTASNNLSDRPTTTAKASWTTGLWTANTKYQTSDLSAVIKEVIDHPRWQEGNSLSLIISYETDNNQYREAKSQDQGLSTSPLLHIEFTAAANTVYYGYFNPDWFYEWNGNKFEHKYKKIGYESGSCAANEWEILDVIGGETVNECLPNATIATGDDTGLWDGNFMNWLTMRKVDITRKVMMGGLATARTGGGNQTLWGEDPGSGWEFIKMFDSSAGAPLTPYHTGEHGYGIKDGDLYVDDDSTPWDGELDSFSLKIQKNETYDPNDFVDGNVSGVMQKVGDQAFFGNSWFYTNSSDPHGGVIANAIDTNMTTLLTDLQNTAADTWTPLAETLFVATQYYRQEKPNSCTIATNVKSPFVAGNTCGAAGFHNSAIGAVNNTNDPFYHDGEFIPCGFNFVLLLTDGASTKDTNIPTFLKDYDADGNDASTFASDGTDYLDDVALYARTVDLRDDLTGDQNIILYPIYAFGNDPQAQNLLKDAARNGGFDDKDGDNIPDGTYSSAAQDRLEWDKDGDGIPDTYFEAQDGYKLERALLDAINDMLQRASSGTAVSVLATSAEGEGSLVQAFFQPKEKNSTGQDINWTGYLQSLWVDARGNLREDTNRNLQLDLKSILKLDGSGNRIGPDGGPYEMLVEQDLIISFNTDAKGNTTINKWSNAPAECTEITPGKCSGAGIVIGTEMYDYDDGDCICVAEEYPDLSNTATLVSPDQPMDSITPIWEAGSQLAWTAPSDRTIFTYLPGKANATFGGTEISHANQTDLQPYFGIKDNSAWGYLGATQTERSNNLISFIQGYNPPSTTDGNYTITDSETFSLRNRLLEATLITDRTTDPVTTTTSQQVWKLGDIVNSTPITVSTPPGLYGITYGDFAYQQYFNQQATRANHENMVYVGANDGMLHAFTSWHYNADDKAYEAPKDPFTCTDIKDPTTCTGTLPEDIGSELWAYLPNALLPHMKWHPRNDYTHVNYVDLPPQIFDVQIFFNSIGDATSGVPVADGYHLNGFGTIVVGGLGMGGRDIPVTDDFDNDGSDEPEKTFTPSYFVIDITNPREPVLLWEKTYDNLNMTTVQPKLVKHGHKWYLSFGSGPETYTGTSTQQSKFYMVDLATGDPYPNATGDDWIFEGTDDRAFIGGIVSFDYTLNYSVEGLYFTETFNSSNNINQPPVWAGNMHKITFPGDIPRTPFFPGTTDITSASTYKTAFDITSDPTSWHLSNMFESSTPLTGQPAIATDRFKNVWIYTGAGRYLNEADKSDLTTQYLYGLKDPFYDKKAPDAGTYYKNLNLDKTLDSTDLFPSDLFDVQYPWGWVEPPVGNCGAVAFGQTGDIYEDESCVCAYEWPVSTCTEVTAGSCAAAGVVEGTDIYDDGDCICLPYQEPVWGCVETGVTPGICDTIGTGIIDDNVDYKSLFWECTGGEVACDGVTFGTVGVGLGDGTCECSEIDPAAIPAPYSCDARPVGDCSTAVYGNEGDISGNGTCIAGYWKCDSSDPVDHPEYCDAVDYTAVSGFLVNNGDYFGNGSCICKFTDTPEAVITGNPGLTFNEIVTKARTFDGWMKATEIPGERVITKPSIIGGISLFTSYLPNADICSFGGESYLWGLYYETGTAYIEPVFDNQTIVIEGVEQVVYKTSLGYGIASSVSVHIGQEEGGDVTGYAQSSSGAISITNINPAFNVRSGMRFWRQD